MAKTNSKQPVTRGMLDDAVDTLLEGMDNLYSRFKYDLGNFGSEMNTRFDNMDDRLRKVEVELSHVKDEVNGFKVELSDTPSRMEFEELKSSVKKHQPLS
jgi:archaellum component FlaC